MENSYYFIPVKIIADEAVIKETLSRIGIPNKQEKILYQTCHLVHYKEQKRIIHFKEYFAINNNDNINLIKMNEADFERRNTILFLLQNWKLIDFENNDDVDYSQYIKNNKTTARMFVLQYQDKQNWDLRTKINLENEEKE